MVAGFPAQFLMKLKHIVQGLFSMLVKLYQLAWKINLTQSWHCQFISTRNIYGDLFNVITTGRIATGAFSRTVDETRYAFTLGQNSYYTNISFDSSRVVSTGAEVKPHTILALPIYIY